MADRRATRSARCWGAILGLMGLLLVTAAPALANHTTGPAPNNCDGSPGDSVAVALLGIAPGQNVELVSQPDGVTYAASVAIEAFCAQSGGAPTGWIAGADITIALSGAGGTVITVNGLPSPQTLITGPTGQLAFTLATTNPSSLNLNISIGTHTELLVRAFGKPVAGPGLFGNIFARTPELGSIALFATGAAGMAGYAVARLRSRRRN